MFGIKRSSFLFPTLLVNILGLVGFALPWFSQAKAIIPSCRFAVAITYLLPVLPFYFLVSDLNFPSFKIFLGFLVKLL